MIIWSFVSVTYPKHRTMLATALRTRTASRTISWRRSSAFCRCERMRYGVLSLCSCIVEKKEHSSESVISTWMARNGKCLTKQYPLLMDNPGILTDLWLSLRWTTVKRRRCRIARTAPSGTEHRRAPICQQWSGSHWTATPAHRTINRQRTNWNNGIRMIVRSNSKSSSSRFSVFYLPDYESGRNITHLWTFQESHNG